MTSNKADVSELLKQLEELKQKKAQNVKKLKKRLGRSVILNQSNSSTEHVIHDTCKSQKKNLSYKPSSLAARSVLGELNSKSDFNDNQVKNYSDAKNIEKTETLCTDAQLNNATGTISESEGGLYLPLNVSYSSKIVPSLKDVPFTKLDVSESVTDNCKIDIERNQVHSRKRPVDYIKDDYLSDNCCDNNKKTKMSEEISTDVSVESNENISSSCFLTNNYSLQKSFNKEPNVVNKDCKKSYPETLLTNKPNIVEQVSTSDLTSTQNVKENNKSSNLISKHGNLMISKDHDIQLQIESSVEKDNSEYKSSLMNVEEVKISSAFVDNSKISLKGSLVELSLKEIVNDICSSETKSESISKMLSKTDTCCDVDLNITEIADTEIKFESKTMEGSFENRVGSLNEDICKNQEEIPNTDVFVSKSPTEVSNTIDGFRNNQDEVAFFAEISTEAPNTGVTKHQIHIEIADNIHELGNIQHDVVNFTEMNTQELKTSVTKYQLPEKTEGFSEECVFTDDEEDNVKYIDSEEIDAIFNTDSEENNTPDDRNDSGENDTPGNKTDLKDEDQCKINKNVESLVAESQVLMVPETELFDFASYNESVVDDIAENISITVNDNASHDKNIECIEALNNINLSSDVVNENTKLIDADLKNCVDFPTIIPEVTVPEPGQKLTIISGIECKESHMETEIDTDSLETEDILQLTNYQEIKRDSPTIQSNLTENDVRSSSLKFQCCLQSDIKEVVTKLKLVIFNDSEYLFIQHIKWIQVWRLEKENGWNKIFAHEVENLELQDLCHSSNESYLVLIMLLKSESNNYCLQFLAFEKESRLIKLMEHTHWFESSCENEKVLLCGLDDLKFVVAQGSVTFQICSHSFTCLDSNPRLLSVTLGSTADCLHSICTIEKLPNALLGMSDNMLYVWHLLEARLVTSVPLQVEEPLSAESCVWGTIENGLVFLIVMCKESEGEPGACQLLAVNLATGFCEVAQMYTLQPAESIRHASDRKMTVAYSEPFIVATCNNGAYIWSVEEKYCCAVLKPANYSSISLVPRLHNSYLIAVGCDGGCVNCYELKCCE